MRRLIRATALLVVLGVSCVSERSAAPAPRRFQPRRWRPVPVQEAARPSPRPVQPAPGDPGWYPRGRRISPRWTSIVIHHSATARGSAGLFDRNHRDKGWDELGYHFVIGNGNGSGDGQIEVGSRWHKQKHGAHCKTPDNHYNEHGIGICLVGDFTKTRPTRAQLASLERLVGFLCSECGISPDRVSTHATITGKTACPGHNFPIWDVRRAVATRVARASSTR